MRWKGEFLIPNVKVGEQMVPKGPAPLPSPPEKQSFCISCCRSQNILVQASFSIKSVLLSTFNCSCLLDVNLSALLDKHCWKNDSG